MPGSDRGRCRTGGRHDAPRGGVSHAGRVVAARALPDRRGRPSRARTGASTSFSPRRRTPPSRAPSPASSRSWSSPTPARAATRRATAAATASRSWSCRSTTRGSATTVPTSCSPPDGRRAVADFPFNSWGEKYLPYDKDADVTRLLCEHFGWERYVAPMILEGGAFTVDGEGTLVTTASCLLHPTRNPGLSKEAAGSDPARLPRRREGRVARGRADRSDRHRRPRRRCLPLRRPRPRDPPHGPRAGPRRLRELPREPAGARRDDRREGPVLRGPRDGPAHDDPHRRQAPDDAVHQLVPGQRGIDRADGRHRATTSTPSSASARSFRSARSSACRRPCSRYGGGGVHCITAAGAGPRREGRGDADGRARRRDAGRRARGPASCRRRRRSCSRRRGASSCARATRRSRCRPSRRRRGPTAPWCTTTSGARRGCSRRSSRASSRTPPSATATAS